MVYRFNVRFGSKAEVHFYVCFTPESDIERVFAHVRFVPIADIPPIHSITLSAHRLFLYWHVSFAM